jgi:hypothetical protein
MKVFTDGKTATGNRARKDVVAEWAGARGLSYARTGKGDDFSLAGMVCNRPWTIERGDSMRDYIRGDELRGRAELGINDDTSVLIMNRPLKESLVKRAYQLYTDPLQTTLDPDLTEEMRWLAMYPEVGWDNLPKTFWTRYAVMADRRDHAMQWIDLNLADQLMAWPEPGPDAQLPFMLLVLRGKAHLRMQYTPADMAALQHTVAIFTRACESAIAGLAADADR